MREVQASDVARGETIVIALHGRSIARIVPEPRASEVIRREGPKRILTTEARAAGRGWPGAAKIR